MFIIHERLPRIPEYGVTLNDWFHNDATAFDVQNPYSIKKRGSGEFLDTALGRDYMIDNNEVGAVQFHSALINGRGRYNNDPYPLTEFTVVEGERYRFRVANTGGEHGFVVSVDDHKLFVVGSDGDDYLPIEVDFIALFPGESIDFELETTESSDLFWLRANTPRKGKGLNPEDDGVIKGGRAIIRYQGSTFSGDPVSEARNCTKQAPCIMFNCAFKQYPLGSWITCIPLSDARSTKSDVYLDKTYGLSEDDSDVEEIFLNLAFPIGSSINGRKYSEARAPMFQPDIEQYITPCDDDVCDATGCLCTHIQKIPYNKTIQIVFSSLTPTAPFMAHHPVHLHGHNFAVLKMGFAEQNETSGFWSRMNQDIYCASQNEFICSKPRWNGGRPELNKIKPPLKDNVMIPSRGYVVVRFRSDNPGFWFLHCHQQSHMLEGMNMLIHEAPGKIKEVPKGFPTCSDFELDNAEYEAYLNDKEYKQQSTEAPSTQPMDSADMCPTEKGKVSI